jgi:quercetin dioxygenase-like cupin family protein
MIIRRFGPGEGKNVPIPALQGVSTVMIHLPKEAAVGLSPEEMDRRYGGLPFVLDRPNLVVVHRYEPGRQMQEHAADEPILFMAIEGSGFLRLGGPEGETARVQAGDAVLWPAGVPHRVWTEDEPLTSILFHFGPEMRTES